LSRGTTLNSDGAEHDQRRKRVAHRMLPRALRAISDRVEATAAAVVDAALDKGDIDGVNDLAAALPLAVVPAASCVSVPFSTAAWQMSCWPLQTGASCRTANVRH
jgi:cytochrome P450